MTAALAIIRARSAECDALTRVDEIAEALLAARRQRRPFVAQPATAPATPEEAYAIQDAVAQGLYPGRRPDAWKVGSPRADVEPTATPLFTVFDSPAIWSDAPVVELTIEAEVGFVLARDIAPAEAATVPLDEAFDFACTTIEVCDARLANYRDAPALWKLADSQVNAGLVVGSGRPFDEVDDYAAVRCEVLVGERIAFDGTGTHALGDPRLLLRWWLQHAGSRARLCAGDVVTTGTWCGMIEAPPGAVIKVLMHGLGEASVEFVA
ncbi:MAG: fumarylacetoacetate hydrolase family protein [Burkholderiaceae bacterium]